jgi:hypothetical protein
MGYGLFLPHSKLFFFNHSILRYPELLAMSLNAQKINIWFSLFAISIILVCPYDHSNYWINFQEACWLKNYFGIVSVQYRMTVISNFIVKNNTFPALLSSQNLDFINIYILHMLHFTMSCYHTSSEIRNQIFVAFKQHLMQLSISNINSFYLRQMNIKHNVACEIEK